MRNNHLEPILFINFYDCEHDLLRRYPNPATFANDTSLPFVF